MVTACKNYLTDRGVTRVWDQPRQPLIEKLKACLRLNQEYQRCFQRTKMKIAEDPAMKPFEFSEMYIFGKFDTFCKRLNEVWVTYSAYLRSYVVFFLHFLTSFLNCIISKPKKEHEISIQYIKSPQLIVLKKPFS